MSTRNPNEDRSAPEAALAPRASESQRAKDARASGRAATDQEIVTRCLKGDQRAWEWLYRRCHPRLRKAVKLLLGVDGSDIHLIEEITASVWYALLRDDCRLLATYDADRDSSLDSFLMGLARIEILRHTRSERRRQSHELIGGRRRLEENRVSDWQVASMMAEFAAMLTPGERRFMERFLTGPAEAENDADSEGPPATSIWQRRHRIRLKLNDFLKDL